MAARRGNVSSFNDGNGIINSEADFNTINALDGNVKVMNQINWCDGVAPNIIGCAGPGDSQIVVRHRPNQEGILWAHEYGHTRGLDHRGDPTALMNPNLGNNHLQVNSDECEHFRD